ncbi:RraA family protein [Actibacterium sp.]|uniref:RraA family protein n=1 Tax=Actibacterium sp. TaxID=1872125 RepID=UPI003562EE5D
MSALVDRLKALDTCVVSDALDALGLPGVAQGLSRLATDTKIAGHVLTVRLEEAKGRTAERHLCTSAIEAAAAGDVIVVEHHSRTDCAGWGGLLSRAASKKGLAGTIIDGLCRDIDEARAFDYPVYGRGSVPRTARGRIIETEFNTAITVDGITVTPGDLVLADGTGIAFLPADRADEIISRAEQLFAKEAAMMTAIDAGISVGSVMAGNYERMLED